jgi:hypothetical protein
MTLQANAMTRAMQGRAQLQAGQDRTLPHLGHVHVVADVAEGHGQRPEGQHHAARAAVPGALQRRAAGPVRRRPAQRLAGACAQAGLAGRRAVRALAGALASGQLQRGRRLAACRGRVTRPCDSRVAPYSHWLESHRAGACKSER